MPLFLIGHLKLRLQSLYHLYLPGKLQDPLYIAREITPVHTGRVLGSTVHYCTIQYNTVQYSTVQYSTVQFTTVQYFIFIFLFNYKARDKIKKSQFTK